jgi:hypothetical protein
MLLKCQKRIGDDVGDFKKNRYVLSKLLCKNMIHFRQLPADQIRSDSPTASFAESPAKLIRKNIVSKPPNIHEPNIFMIFSPRAKYENNRHKLNGV